MKKFLLSLIVMFLCAVSTQAVPAKPGLATVTQPDGTTLTIRLVGDEYLHYNVTEDGYTVVRDSQGYYVYAELSAEKQLMPTTQVAHNAEARSEAELKFLSGVQKYLQPAMKESVEKEMKAERQRRQKALEERRAPNYDYSKFRGLVILVEYNDKSFDRTDYPLIASEMINSTDYTGYNDWNGRFVSCTGSVRDYFRDNSMGLFQPEFDIVGPIQVDRSQYYANGTNNASQLTLDVMTAADEQVDFSLYDGDGDGWMDMVFFIFAGHGSNVGGNNSKLLWPHASVIYDPTTNRYVQMDGVWLGRYACSTELSYGEKDRTIDGIGTICHEFSHVLGLPDFYDTDYKSSGGESADPGEWSLMAGGCYNNSARTPAGYSLFERYMAGFAMPQVIEEEESFTLEPLHTSNTGYRINTPVKKEFFILENRQQEKWDQYLPGHGMLVFRVDSTNTRIWDSNQLNCDPKHNYYELVRAKGSKAKGEYDPFPGKGKVTMLNNGTSPANLKTWAGKETKYGLLNIAENNGVITFDIENAYLLRELLLPEIVQVGAGLSTQLRVTAVPEYAVYTLTWSVDNEDVLLLAEDGLVFGLKLGEATVTVTADNGLTASCLVQVVNTPETNDIATFKTFTDIDVAVLNFTDAEVIFVYEKEKDFFVRDATGCLILRNAQLTAKAGDKLGGMIAGKMEFENDMPTLKNVETVTDYTTVVVNEVENPNVQPTLLTVDELTPEHYADLIALENVPLVNESGIYIVNDAGEKVCRLYNSYQVKGIKVPSKVEGKRFNLLGIYSSHAKDESSSVVYFDLVSTPVEVVPEGIETIDNLTIDNLQLYDLSGRKVSSAFLHSCTPTLLKKGIYIVNGKKVVIK